MDVCGREHRRASVLVATLEPRMPLLYKLKTEHKCVGSKLTVSESDIIINHRLSNLNNNNILFAGHLKL